MGLEIDARLRVFEGKTYSKHGSVNLLINLNGLELLNGDLSIKVASVEEILFNEFLESLSVELSLELF